MLYFCRVHFSEVRELGPDEAQELSLGGEVLAVPCQGGGVAAGVHLSVAPSAEKRAEIIMFLYKILYNANLDLGLGGGGA